MYGASYSQMLQFFLIVFGVVFLVCYIWITACFWKIFSKAGEPGWKAIIPYYSNYIISNIVFGNSYYFIVGTVTGIVSLIVQFTGITILILVTNIIMILLYVFLTIRMAKVFGKGTGFTIGMVLLPYIFWAILGFGKSEYIGPKKIVD